MDYEQKYKEALEKAKKELLTCSEYSEAARQIYRLFPELAESKDERIRKEIVGFFLGTHIRPTVTPEQLKGWIDWLEKQGKQKTIKNLSEAKRWFGTAIEKAVEQTKNNYDITNCDIDYWWEDFILFCDLEDKSIEWGEEDEKMMQSIIDILHALSVRTRTDVTTKNYNCWQEIEWFKSLKKRLGGAAP